MALSMGPESWGPYIPSASTIQNPTSPTRARNFLGPRTRVRALPAKKHNSNNSTNSSNEHNDSSCCSNSHDSSNNTVDG